MNYYYQPQQEVKHKVFISFYHYDDQAYRDAFVKVFGHLFISKSVEDGDIDSENSDEYVKRLIQEKYLDDTSVVAVLCGPNTLKRKHVDWEISAALDKKVGGYAGLFGILLPEFPLTSTGNYYPKNLPPRLAKNIKIDDADGFAKIYTWDWLTASEDRVKNAIQAAFDDRVTKANLIDNSLPQFSNNRS